MQQSNTTLPTRESPTRRRRKIPAIVGVHEYANVMPMLSGDGLNDMAASIQRNGLLDPIVVTPEGLILDGRNRREACRLAGVEPTVVVYDGDPAEYVRAKNNQRRHLSLGQRAMADAVVLQKDGRRVEGRWTRGSVVNPEIANPEFGISESKTWQNEMSRAGIILDYTPELADDVIQGRMKLDKAFGMAEEKRGSKKPPGNKGKQAKPRPLVVQLADTREALNHLKAKRLPEAELQLVKDIHRAAARIINDDLNGTS